MIDSAMLLTLDRSAAPRFAVEVVDECIGVLQRIAARQPETKSYGITSAVAGEGRSTVAAGLAIANATVRGRATVLVDLDHPSYGQQTGESSNQKPSGAAERIVERIEWVRPELGFLQFEIPQADLSGSTELVGAVLALLEGRGFDLVGDLPPLSPQGSASAVAGTFDVVVQVVLAGSTPVEAVVAAGETLPGRPLVVLNKTHSALPRWLAPPRTA